MLAIMSQHPATIQPRLAWQFKKLVIIRLFNENILIFLLQYIGLLMLDGLNPQTNIPIWFASGTAGGFLFMRGFSILPGLFFGSFFAYLSVSSMFNAMFNAAIHAMQAFLLLWLSYRYINPTLIFYRIQPFFKFMICCSLLTAMTSCMFALFYYPDFHDSILFFQLWLKWWLGNLNGILIFSFSIITLDFYFSQSHDLRKLNKSLFLFYFGLLCFMGFALVLSETWVTLLLFSLLTLMILLSISWRFGWCGIVTGVFILGLLLNFAACLPTPLFSNPYSFQALIVVQCMLLVGVQMGLSIAIFRGD